MRKTLFFIILLSVSSFVFAQLPTNFDLRNYDGNNFVSSVKSQQGGTCWTHGTMSALEGNLLMSGVWEDAGESGEPDLAEYHLDWWNGFNQHNNDDTDPPTGGGLEVHMGGDYMVTTAYISRLEGLVRDIDGQSYGTPPLRVSEDYHYFYPRRVEWYTAGENLETIDTIKTKIMEHGVMATCMCYNASFMDGSFNHYQPVINETLPNHSIAIIGWDDDHIVPAAPENGAWLCKNSWGSDWGNAGYFWISYYDKWACQEPEMGAVSFIDVEPLQYTNVYYHDYHGWRDTYTGSKTAFNTFQATEDSWLKSVNFFTTADSVDYTIKIYDEYGEMLTGLRSTTEGFALHKGMHTVDLDLEFLLEDEDLFYIYLKVSKGGLAYDRTSDVPVLLGSDVTKTTVESISFKNQSYYFSSCCGWTDFFEYEDPSGYEETGNFCIKGLSEETIPEDFGAVFKVTNSVYGWGLYNAEIHFNDDVILTDNEGYAQITDIVPNKNMEFTITANGYQDYTGTLEIIDNSVFLDVGLEYLTDISSFEKAGISLYPNPSNGIFTVETNNFSDYKIEITDIAGKIIYSKNNAVSTSKIDLSNQNSGLYFVKITNKDKIYTQEIVIK